MGWKHTALSAVRRIGGLRLVEAFYGRSRVTVLAYHRVVDPGADDFAGFVGNVSATLVEFEAQIAWIADRMSPISLEQLRAAATGQRLPDRAVLVTFDDGYRDNLTTAAPVLERHGVPAAIFLATDHIGTTDPFWWDLAAWRFAVTTSTSADLPLLGARTWTDPRGMAAEWIGAAKRVPNPVKLEALAGLGDVLGGGEPDEAFGSTLLSWDEVTLLASGGWSIGAHTCSHPILTSLEATEIGREVGESVDRVRSATGRPVTGFAYPNGQPDDFDETARDAVTAAGVPLAFTLVPGPARPAEIAADPLAIRRVYVHHGDDPTRFAAKVAGVPRLVGRS